VLSVRSVTVLTPTVTLPPYGEGMDITDPLLVVGGLSLIAAGLAMLSSRLIQSATAEIAAELSDEDPELSRIRPR
jgi:hypothetical protein